MITLLKFIFSFVRKQKTSFFILIFSAILKSAFLIAFMYIIKVIINITAQDTSKGIENALSLLGYALIGASATWLLLEISRRVFAITRALAMPKFSANIREYTLDYMSRHSISYFSERLTGTVANNAHTLPNNCSMLVTIFFMALLPFFISLILSLFIVSSVSYLFCALFFVWTAAHLVASAFFAKKRTHKSAAHAKAVSNLNGRVVDIFNNIFNVIIFSARDYEKEAFYKYQDTEVKANTAALWQHEKVKLTQSGINLIMIITVVYLLISEWSSGTVTPGDFALILMLVLNLLELAMGVSYQISLWYQEMGSAKAALEMIFTKHDIVDAPNAKNLAITNGTIAFNNIFFGYSQRDYLFNNLSLRINPGEKIGLVGSSGVGKSTIIKLLLRLYDVNKGNIEIDDQDISLVTQDSLRANITVITQEPLLFNRSFMENIRYARPDATDSDVIHAAKLAYCHDFIIESPNAYQTIVGDHGVKLSGGQRQRISIARAFLKNTKILLLDEATSSLDSITENQIQESLNLLTQDKTVIVISHHLSTLKKMSRILVFDKGKVVEEGPIDVLLQNNGIFRKLWDTQFDII